MEPDTALPDDQIRCICEGCKRGLELVHNGNEKIAIEAARAAMELKCPHRVILGTDGPASNDDLDLWEEMRLPELKPKRSPATDESDLVREGWDKRGARSRLDRRRRRPFDR